MALTPAQVHALGLAEVERTRARLSAAMLQSGFAGDLKAFFAILAHDPRSYFANADELLNAYRELKPRVAAAMPSLFAYVPQADFDIRASEPYRSWSDSAAAYETASPDGRRPGVLYVDTADLASRPRYAVAALFLHEGLPGHHLQTTIQVQRRDLPRFLRDGRSRRR